MKSSILLLALTSSLFFFSCQKEAGVIHDPINTSSNNVPFMGDYVTTAVFLAGPSVQRITGVGTATHLGQNTFVANATVNFSTPPPFAVQGTAVFTAANGDQFFTSFTGTSTPTGPGTSRGDFVHTITGGTGRFSDITGTLVGVAIVTVGSPTNTVSYQGTINF